MNRLVVACALTVISTIGASAADASGRGIFGGCRRSTGFCRSDCWPQALPCQTGGAIPVVGEEGSLPSIRVQDIQNRVIGIQGQIGPGNGTVQQKLDQIKAALEALDQSIKNNPPRKPD